MADCTNETFITRISAWAPGVESADEWKEWALGRRNIRAEAKSPELSYTASAFRRRLSQISKMSIQVIHDLLPLQEETKILFFSFRGEIVREYQLLNMWLEEGELSPAAFSLSGFNTPVALASIAFELKGGYSALYPVKNSFNSCVKAAQAALHTGIPEDIVLLYADEAIPPECMCFFKNTAPELLPQPAAFALYLSKKPASQSVPISSIEPVKDNPLEFFKQLLLKETLPLNSSVIKRSVTESN